MRQRTVARHLIAHGWPLFEGVVDGCAGLKFEWLVLPSLVLWVWLDEAADLCVAPVELILGEDPRSGCAPQPLAKICCVLWIPTQGQGGKESGRDDKADDSAWAICKLHRAASIGCSVHPGDQVTRGHGVAAGGCTHGQFGAALDRKVQVQRQGLSSALRV